MRIHYVQNDPLSELGFIEEWMAGKGHAVTSTRTYEDADFPVADEFDLLIILGGRMGAYEEALYPWIASEKECIRQAVQHQKGVLGICLGAQMIAAALGSPVYPHVHQEIGWWPVELTEEARGMDLFEGVPAVIPAFQYHGDTFDLPGGATHLASSPGCKNQAFLYGDRVIGLQFHPEFTEGVIADLAEKFGHQLPDGPYIQRADRWIHQGEYVEGAKSLLFKLLDHIESQISL